MVVTGSLLVVSMAVAVGGHFAKHRIRDPRFPLWVGLVLTILAPAFLTALAIETILLFTWNPLIWME